MTDTRATCWSITINNPTEKDYTPELPGGWKMTGQVEVGDQGTRHYQGMLTTNQQRFSAIQKVFPRAHIEVAKNRKALEKYVHKTDTRVEVVPDRQSNIPTLFDYQHTVALRWNPMDFEQMCNQHDREDVDEVALLYLDTLVAEDIRKGVRGIEFIAINPMWRSSWKKFWRPIISRAIDIECTRTVAAIPPAVANQPADPDATIVPPEASPDNVNFVDKDI